MSKFLILCISILLGAAVRATFVFGHETPVFDGGLWYVLGNLLAEKNFNWPRTFVFNGEETPLFYPPLAAYLIAALHVLFSWPVLSILRYLPAFLSILTIPAFYLFFQRFVARSFYQGDAHRQRLLAGLGVLLFPVIWQSYASFAAGGGVPRSLGLIFLLLHWAFLLGEKGHRNTLLAGLSLGLAAVTHPDAAFWAALGGTCFCLCDRITDRARWFSAALIGAALSALWWGPILAHYGVEPFLQAQQESAKELTWKNIIFIHGNFLGGGFFGLLALAGIAQSLLCRRFALPLCCLAALMYDQRGLMYGHGVAATIPLVAISSEAILQALRSGLLRYAGAVFALILMCCALVPTARDIGPESSVYNSLTREDQESFFALSSRLIKPDSKILFLRQDGGEFAALGEWLAVFSKTQVRPLAYVSEWRGTYMKELRTQNEIAACCRLRQEACLRRFYEDNRQAVDYLVIHERSCGDVLRELPGSSQAGLKIVPMQGVSR